MANPPITIGPFNNVPAPGSPIASAWAQELSTYVAALPRGVVGRAIVTAPQNGISGAAQLAGLTVTWTAEAGRRYKTSIKIPITKDATGAAVWVDIQTGTAQHVEQFFTSIVGSATLLIAGFTIEENIGGGSATRRVQVTTNAGTVNVSAGVSNRALLIVEDVGPAAGLPTLLPADDDVEAAPR